MFRPFRNNHTILLFVRPTYLFFSNPDFLELLRLCTFPFEGRNTLYWLLASLSLWFLQYSALCCKSLSRIVIYWLILLGILLSVVLGTRYLGHLLTVMVIRLSSRWAFRAHSVQPSFWSWRSRFLQQHGLCLSVSLIYSHLIFWVIKNSSYINRWLWWNHTTIFFGPIDHTSYFGLWFALDHATKFCSRSRVQHCVGKDE